MTFKEPIEMPNNIDNKSIYEIEKIAREVKIKNPETSVLDTERLP